MEHDSLLIKLLPTFLSSEYGKSKFSPREGLIPQVQIQQKAELSCLDPSPKKTPILEERGGGKTTCNYIKHSRQNQ